MTRWEGGMEEGVRGILSLFHNCMNFKYTVIRSSSAFTAGTGTIAIILDLQGWLTVKRQAAFAPLLTHAGQVAKDAGFGNTLSLCVCVCVCVFFLKHIRQLLFYSRIHRNYIKVYLIDEKQRAFHRICCFWAASAKQTKSSTFFLTERKKSNWN